MGRDSHGRFVKGSGGGGKVTDRDRGYKDLVKRLTQKAKRVTVGIHSEEGSQTDDESGATVAEIGTFHEFGFGVPRRSFIGDWADENEQKNRSDLRKVAEAVASGKVASLEQGLNRFGLRKVGEVQQRIKAGIAPELAEATVEAKGSSTPLIDRGTLWQSIRHQVSDGAKDSEDE